MDKLYKQYIDSSGVWTDTRNILKDSLFIALKGANFDGNEFIHEAIEAGAKYAVTDSKNGKPDPRIIVVDDCLETLQGLANFHRRKLNIPVIGITGSNGKTTSKELLHASLSAKFKVFSTPGNFNNHIGLPLSILQIKHTHEIAVLELGDNHIGEIAALCKIAEPSHCYLTNIGKDHIEGFGSFENNVKAKLELFDYAKSSNSIVFLDPEEDSVYQYGLKLKERIEFPIGDAILFKSNNGFVEFISDGNSYSTNLVGEYNQANIRAAYYIAKHFKVEIDKASTAIANYVPSNNRSQLVNSEQNTIYLDAYNANPSSMALALDSFSKLKLRSNRVVILGDMLELGASSISEHNQILDLCKRLSFDRIIVVGHEFGQCHLSAEIEHFDRTESLLAFLKKQGIVNSQVFLKGSRGIKLEQLLEEL